MRRQTTTLVKFFHEKFQFPVSMPWGVNSQPGVPDWLNTLSKTIAGYAKAIKDDAIKAQAAGDERLYRAHLMIEELSEVLEAMFTGNQEDFADGLADLDYVVHGTAVTYGLQLETLTEEAHRSNMTKERSKADPRMSVRPPTFSPPDFLHAIDRARARFIDWQKGLRVQTPEGPGSVACSYPAGSYEMIHVTLDADGGIKSLPFAPEALSLLSEARPCN